MLKLVSVAPSIGAPFLVHWCMNGPVPETTVLKEAALPGQRLAKPTKAVAVVVALRTRLMGGLVAEPSPLLTATV